MCGRSSRQRTPSPGDAKVGEGAHAADLHRRHAVDTSEREWRGHLPEPVRRASAFQIDGNFGCASGVTEMLLQSHDGAVHLLPALPDDWAASGGVSGLRAYGGFEPDFTWLAGQVTKVVIRSGLGGNARVRVPNELVAMDGATLTVAAGKNPNAFFEVPVVKAPIISASAKLNDVVLAPTHTYDLSTVAGKTYVLKAK